MNPTENSNEHPGFLLLFRGTDWHRSLSIEQVETTMEAWGKWICNLSEQGRLITGTPLEPQGQLIAVEGNQILDQPIAETKEMIGGLFHLNVQTMDEAMAIGRDCPALIYGVKVEVRPLRTTCPAQQMIDEIRESALA